jgi:cell division protein FtsB
MYGIDTEAQKAPGYLNVWQKAFEDFQKNFSELAIMMDLVPRKDYIALSRENQELKKRIAELEEGNARFRALLDEKVTPAAGLKGFQDLVNEQARQYQDFMKSIGNVFAEKPEKPEAQASFKTKPAEAPAAKAKPKPAQAAKKPAHSGSKAGK